jgi:UDPglucose 6-dehydrogenase
MKIGIIGAGVLGNTQKDWLLKNTNHEVLVYDVNQDKGNSTLESIVRHALIFVLCLPTDAPEKGSLYAEGKYLRTGAIENTIAFIAKNKGDGRRAVVIRSTVPLGFTRTLAEKYPDLQIYFVPEFLTEKTATVDFANERTITIGTANSFKDIPAVVALMGSKIFPATDFKIRKYEEAEMLKLATNSFYALKVTFANELADICKKNGVNYGTLKNDLARNPRIGSHPADNQGADVHLRIAQDGKAGYGGKCLTKDTRQLIEIAKEKKAGFGLLAKVDSINTKIRK